MNKFRELIEEEIRKDTAYNDERGYKQRPREEGGHTTGDFIRATMKIKDEATAAAYYEGYVEYLRNMPDLGHDPEYVAKANIGWCFGEGMKPELIAMWNQVCEATHPVFGTTVPTFKEAFDAGVEMGEKAQ